MARTGRPTSYNDNMPKKVIKYGKRGLSKEAIAGELGITKSTLYRWIDPEDKYYKPEFSYAVELAETFSHAYIEKLAFDALRDKEINNSALGLIARNRIGWDKKKVQIEGGDTPVSFVFKWDEEDDK